MCERFFCQVVEKPQEILCVFPRILKPHGGKRSAQTAQKEMEESLKTKSPLSPIDSGRTKCPRFHLNSHPVDGHFIPGNVGGRQGISSLRLGGAFAPGRFGACTNRSVSEKPPDRVTYPRQRLYSGLLYHFFNGMSRGRVRSIHNDQRG